MEKSPHCETCEILKHRNVRRGKACIVAYRHISISAYHIFHLVMEHLKYMSRLDYTELS